MEKTLRGDRALLRRVAALCGIEPRYEDGWGQRHDVNEETLEALLAALGYPAQSPNDLLDVLDDLCERACRAVVDPVQVVSEGIHPVVVGLTVPESLAYGRYRWHLRREDGSEAQGEGFLSAVSSVEDRGFLGKPCLRRLLYLWEPVACGYHDLEVHLHGPRGEVTARQRLIIVPRRAYLPEALRGDGKVWGITGQLYSVRSARNWGIGSFSDLNTLIDWAADLGASFVGINPLCLLFPEDPSKVSPYGPSSRRYLQPWYIDVEAVPEFAECEEVRRWCGQRDFQEACRAARDSSLVDYGRVWALQREALQRLFQHFCEHHLRRGSERARSFQGFVSQGGQDLEDYGVFHALDAHFRRINAAVWGWTLWPKAYQDKTSTAVRRFALEHRDAVTLHQYVAWIAREQLAACGHRSWERGLAVGIYGDLPVGVDPAGLDTWLDPHVYALNVRLGAPPDAFNPVGQEWGVCPMVPQRLRDEAYEPFVAMVRANMREFGALRIDHVMGLMRQFWIPAGKDARFGAYVRYPLEDLLGIVLLESERNQCLIVGEDLGTVPQRIREAMAERGLFGCRLCLFERSEDGSFPSPQDYPLYSMVSFATHDLPTLEGFWQGTDLRLRRRLQLYPSPQVRKGLARRRVADKKALRVLLRSWGHQEEPLCMSKERAAKEHCRAHSRAAALYRYLAACGSKLLAVSLEDLSGMTEQVNVPGTVHEHPNWRRKLPFPMKTLQNHPRVRAIVSAVAEHRP
ncbi:4-alpha-glucanotransferase [Desulfosoma sp.]|uniref:4-alpha-glucanotransferase n=1 Tax=Desulfosoma sp. TaxID=2603217 RepID=UPI00404B6A6B